jgi:hypothetical protein
VNPGDTIHVNGHPFRLETQSSDGYILFLRTGDDEVKAFATKALKDGGIFSVESKFLATHGWITAVRPAKSGELRVRLELGQSLDELSPVWPR